MAAKRVLILHDDPEARTEYYSILWYNGFDVETADDAAQARRAAEVRAPDLVLLGISSGSTRGFELCQELGKVPGAHRIPVRLLSRHLDPDRARAARRSGCTTYLEEPMPLVEVLFAVERLIGRSVPDEIGDPTPPVPGTAVGAAAAAPATAGPALPLKPPLQVVVDPAPPPPLHAIESSAAEAGNGSAEQLPRIVPIVPRNASVPEEPPAD